MTSFGSLSTYLLFFIVSFIFYLLFIFFFGGGGGSKTPLAFLFEIFYNKTVFHGGVPPFSCSIFKFQDGKFEFIF